MFIKQVLIRLLSFSGSLAITRLFIGKPLFCQKPNFFNIMLEMLEIFFIFS